MSLKITVELDGQTEQQIAPVVARWVANHPEWIGVGADADDRRRSPAQLQGQPFHHDNSALLQQHIQRLANQNKLLQEQLSYSQRLLAGVPSAKALPAAEQAKATGSTTERTQRAHPTPTLPVQYRHSHRSGALYQIQRPFRATARGCGRSLVWLWRQKGWLLIFLLMSGMMYGVLAVAPIIADLLWKPPELVESPDSSPGNTANSEPPTETPEQSAPPTNQSGEAANNPPIAPTSKAGSHPPPPPAFQQQPAN